MINNRNSNDEVRFVKEIGKILQKYRKNAKLSQSELAEKMGLSRTSGFKYISYLETGRIKNPSLLTILRYLKICQVLWPKFFQELAQIDFNLQHQKYQVAIPSDLPLDLQKKIDRDTALYLIKIQYPKPPFDELDWQRIQEKVDKKVNELLSHQGLNETDKIPYLNFVNELIKNYDTPQSQTVFEKYYRTKELNWRIISEIRSIIYKVIRMEQKRLKKPKALDPQKISTMARKFLAYRIQIEPIEAEVQKKLSELGVPTLYHQGYKDFCRECFSLIKKFYQKKPKNQTEAKLISITDNKASTSSLYSNLNLIQKVTELIKKWKTLGLKEEVLQIVKDIVISHFRNIQREEQSNSDAPHQ